MQADPSTSTVGQNNNTTTPMYADQAGVGRAHLGVGLVPRRLVPRQEAFVELIRRWRPRAPRRVSSIDLGLMDAAWQVCKDEFHTYFQHLLGKKMPKL